MTRKILPVLFLLLYSLGGFANEQALLDSANMAYSQNKYDVAITNYEKIISDGFDATEVYYNLGNAYYKSNQIARAILNYEKALKLAPNDEDITFNLKLANQKIADKIETVPQLFITEWKDSFINSYSEKGWSLIGIGLFILSLLLLAIYFISNKLLLKQTCFGFALLFLVSSILTFFIAKTQYTNLTRAKDAIVMSSSIDVNSSPTADGTRVFVLHEGTKVSILKTNADWIEIKIPNGNVGWVKIVDVVFI